MSHLFFLGHISPHGAELLCLVASVDVVEDCKFRPNEVGEMSDLDITEIESNQILMMEDHTSDPLIVRPATKSGDSVDGSDVEKDEKKSSSATRQALIMRGNLLGANCLEQGLHIVEVREH